MRQRKSRSSVFFGCNPVILDFPLVGLGVPPCWRAFFLLLRQKKEAKEKATPRSAPGVARFLALLVRPGGLPELACGSNMANRLPPARLRCSAPSTGIRKAEWLNLYHQDDLLRSTGEKAQKKPSLSWQWPCLGPLRGAEQRRNAGGFRLALFEPQASLARRPAFRVAQGTGVAGTDPGVAFSLATFFWPPKESTPARQAEPPAN